MIRMFYSPDGEQSAPQEQKFELTNEPISFDELINSRQQEDGQQEKPVVEPEPNVQPEQPILQPAPEIPQVIEPTKEAPPIEPDWRELVQKQDRKEVYKFLDIDEKSLAISQELADDEFVAKLLTYRRENGNLTPFIEAATKDWDKVSPETLILDDLKKQYLHLSADKAEKLAKSDFNSRFVYKEDPTLSDEDNKEMAELMSLKLESEVEKVRIKRKEEQKQFLDSITPVDRTQAQQKAEQERILAEQKEFEKFKNLVDSNPASVKLATDKKIVLGEKENSFNYTVNPDTIKEKTFDTNKFYGLFWGNQNGTQTFDADRWNRVVAYAENPQTFESALINHGISLGQKEIVDKELVNVPPKHNQQQPVSAKTLAKAFAEEGQPISYDELIRGT